ncbi:hypothetical protein AAZV13_18G208200 [Glycine max]
MTTSVLRSQIGSGFGVDLCLHGKRNELLIQHVRLTDKWIWLLDADKGFWVAATYIHSICLSTQLQESSSSSRNQSKFWVSKAPSKVLVFSVTNLGWLRVYLYFLIF